MQVLTFLTIKHPVTRDSPFILDNEGARMKPACDSWTSFVLTPFVPYRWMRYKPQTLGIPVPAMALALSRIGSGTGSCVLIRTIPSGRIVIGLFSLSRTCLNVALFPVASLWREIGERAI